MHQSRPRFGAAFFVSSLGKTQRGPAMIDHITFGISDFDRSTAFYDAALAPLAITRCVTLPPSETDGIRVTGYGTAQPFFWLAEERALSGLLHVAFRATSQAQVAAFYTTALDAGGTDNGAPGLRPQYHSGYFAAFVQDPDGHNIEAVWHAPTA